MKANEFVKKFGWDVAKVKTMSIYKDNPFQEELKRLVESYELVQSYGGIEKSKLKVRGNRLSYKRLALLSRAIADVESCM